MAERGWQREPLGWAGECFGVQRRGCCGGRAPVMLQPAPGRGGDRTGVRSPCPAAQGPQIPPGTHVLGPAGLSLLHLWGLAPDFWGGTEGSRPPGLVPPGLAPGTAGPPPRGSLPKGAAGPPVPRRGCGWAQPPGTHSGGPGPVLGALPVGPGRGGPNSTEKPGLGASGARISLWRAAAPKHRVLPAKRASAAGGSRQGRTGAAEPE